MRSFRKRIAQFLIVVMLVSLQVSLGSGGVKAVTVPCKFDFGLGTSPVMPGYIAGNTTNAAYSSAIGYGWVGTLPSATDRSAYDACDSLLRDYVNAPGPLTNMKTFRVDLPNGEYYVKVVQGDAQAAHNSNMNIDRIVNGASPTPIASGLTGTNTWKTTIFQATVSDGMLQIGFSSNVASPGWVLNALEISQNPFDGVQVNNLSVLGYFNVGTPSVGNPAYKRFTSSASQDQFYPYAHVSNYSDSPKSVCAVIALYDKNNVLQKVQVKEYTIPAGGDLTINKYSSTAAPTDMAITGITASSGWTVKTFIWNDISSLVPYCNAYAYTIP